MLICGDHARPHVISLKSRVKDVNKKGNICSVCKYTECTETGRVCEGGVLNKTLRVIVVERWRWWLSGCLAAPCSCWGAGSLWGGNRDHVLWRRNKETAAPKGHQMATIFQSALGGRSDREEGLAVPEITAEDKRRCYSVLNPNNLATQLKI